MISKKKLPVRSGLYVVLDAGYLNEKRIVKTARLALQAGASVIQLRDKRSSAKSLVKTAMVLKRIAKRYGAPFLINDRLEVAVAADLDGAHIGQGEIALVTARKLLGADKIMGVSVNNVKQAREAKEGGADYLGPGPIFATPIKNERRARGVALLGRIKNMGIPFFAIGGIDCRNICKLTTMGFKNVAVIRAVCKARDPFKAARRLKEAIA